MLHVRHSGRLAPHHHTSYAGLAFALMLTAVVLTGVSFEVQAEDPGPVTKGVGVNASVAQKIPKAPAISAPASGLEVTSSPINVSGTCENGSIVKIFSNDILVGATSCNGTYAVPVGVFSGLNTLRAQGFNSVEQPGPSSAAVGVRYAVAGPVANPTFQRFSESNTASNQFFIKADTFHIAPGKEGETVWPIEIVGGSAPYAINVSWGDGKTDVYSLSNAGTLELKHKYENADGKNFPVVVKAADGSNARAYIQLVAVSNAAAKPVAKAPFSLLVAWPILLAAVVMVFSFWLGERFELRALRNQGQVRT